MFLVRGPRERAYSYFKTIDHFIKKQLYLNWIKEVINERACNLLT